MKKRVNCSPKVSRVGCVLMVSIGGRSEVGVEVGIDKELTCLGLWKIEQKSLASAIFASSETVGKDSSRYPRPLTLLISSPSVLSRKLRQDPHQGG